MLLSIVFTIINIQINNGAGLNLDGTPDNVNITALQKDKYKKHKIQI